MLIVAENACNTFGGEAALPLRYFTSLRARGVEAWLLTHARVREELARTLPGEFDRVYFVEDTALHRFLWRLGEPLEPRLRRMTTDLVLRFVTQHEQRIVARKLIARFDVDVVHQPTPVSPSEPSLMRNLGAPVVIGPMNGKTSYPPAFRSEEGPFTRLLLRVAPAFTPVLNGLIRGKMDASMLLVANERSRMALPRKTRAQVVSMPDNGVDTAIWQWRGRKSSNNGPCRFAFVGRLVRSKGVDLWLLACKQLIESGCNISVVVIGDGPERAALERQAQRDGLLADCMGTGGKVFFPGWQPEQRVAELLAEQDCLVLPTLIEAGGAVLLEAMAVGLPVIATDWGGPIDYVDSACGILVHPHSRAEFITGLASAMKRLASDPQLRERMGAAGRRKVEHYYDWDRKIDAIIHIYGRAGRSVLAAEVFETA